MWLYKGIIIAWLFSLRIRSLTKLHETTCKYTIFFMNGAVYFFKWSIIPLFKSHYYLYLLAKGAINCYYLVSSWSWSIVRTCYYYLESIQSILRRPDWPLTDKAVSYHLLFSLVLTITIIITCLARSLLHLYYYYKNIFFFLFGFKHRKLWALLH